jgi:hypothetical protein
MAPGSNDVARSAPVKFPYHVIRSVTAPEDADAGRKRYCGVAPANALFGVGTGENVRSFLGLDEEGNKRKSTQVNMRIKETLKENREIFHLLNTGVVIVSRKADVDDQKRIAALVEPSIINGAQTRGVLEEWFRDHPEDTEFPSINFELLVADEDELVAEISIARNYQNKVEDLSIYGRQRLIDPLEDAMRAIDGSIKLRKSETDFGDEYLDTEKLIQILTVLTPTDVPLPSTTKRKEKTPETIYRVYAYRHRSRCLKDFAEVMNKPEEWPQAYRAFLDLAVDGWRLYQKLKGEQAFSGLQCVKGDVAAGKKRVLPDGVPDGIVFPMVSAMSRFVKAQRDGAFKLQIPRTFPWHALYQGAKIQETTTARNNPQSMGKDFNCYVALHGAIDMYFAVTES